MRLSLLINDDLCGLGEGLVILGAHAGAVRPRPLDGHQVPYVRFLHQPLLQLLRITWSTGKQVPRFTTMAYHYIWHALLRFLLYHNWVLSAVSN